MKLLLSAGLKLDRVSLTAMALPLALWLPLWLTLGSGPLPLMPEPGVSQFLVNGVRGALPLLAGYLAVAILFIRLIRQRPQGPWRLSGRRLQARWVYNPLVLAGMYGLVGVVSSLLFSPQWPNALYWSVAYLSVPLVLWAGVQGPGAIEHLRRIIDLNNLIVVLAVAILFTIALAQMHLGDVILHPAAWFECKLRDTIASTFLGEVRSTGMARYAAMGGIVALGSLWRPRFRWLWGFLLVASLILLLTLGSRGAYVGFGAAVALMGLVYGGKKAVVTGVVALAVLVPIAWGTGIHEPLLAKCALRGLASSIPTGGASSASEEPAGLSIPGVMSGRAATWAAGWEVYQQSPLLGFGFQADRFLIGNHAHNALLQALLQTGLIGALPFVAAMAAAWFLLAQALRKLRSLPVVHRHLTIQVGGMLTFLSLRAIPESTGAFFGVDWLLLAPLLLYLHLVNHPALGLPTSAAKTSPPPPFQASQPAGSKHNGHQCIRLLRPGCPWPSFRVLSVRIGK